MGLAMLIFFVLSAYARCALCFRRGPDERACVSSCVLWLLVPLLLAQCGQAPEAYIDQLKSLQESKRVKAANRLIRFDADEVVPLLIAEAQSGYIRVRFEVIGLLGRFKDPRGIPTLINALDDKSPNVAARAALGLAQLRAVEALPRLLHYVRDPSEVTRQYVLSALGPCHSYELEPALSDSALAAVLDALRSPKHRWRIAALQSLREFGYKDGTESVIRMARDPSPEVRHVAVQALGQIGSQQHVGDGGPDPINPISEGELDNVLEALIASLDASELQGVRTKAVRALSVVGDARARKPLETLVRTGGEEDQTEAMRALEKLP